MTLWSVYSDVPCMLWSDVGTLRPLRLRWLGATAGGPTTSPTSFADLAWSTTNANARIGELEASRRDVRSGQTFGVRFRILRWLD